MFYVMCFIESVMSFSNCCQLFSMNDYFNSLFQATIIFSYHTFTINFKTLRSILRISLDMLLPVIQLILILMRSI